MSSSDADLANENYMVSKKKQYFEVTNTFG